MDVTLDDLCIYKCLLMLKNKLACASSFLLLDVCMIGHMIPLIHACMCECVNINVNICIYLWVLCAFI